MNGVVCTGLRGSIVENMSFRSTTMHSLMNVIQTCTVLHMMVSKTQTYASHKSSIIVHLFDLKCKQMKITFNNEKILHIERLNKK